MQIACLKLQMLINLVQKVEIIFLLAKEIIVIKEYLNFIDIFFKKLMVILPKFFNINKYVIDLKLDKQLSYKLFYNLELIKLKNFKTYIKTNLVNKFI